MGLEAKGYPVPPQMQFPSLHSEYMQNAELLYPSNLLPITESSYKTGYPGEATSELRATIQALRKDPLLAVSRISQLNVNEAGLLTSLGTIGDQPTLNSLMDVYEQYRIKHEADYLSDQEIIEHFTAGSLDRLVLEDENTDSYTTRLNIARALGVYNVNEEFILSNDGFDFQTAVPGINVQFDEDYQHTLLNSDGTPRKKKNFVVVSILPRDLESLARMQLAAISRLVKLEQPKSVIK